MTLWWLSDDYLMTIWWLSNDYSMNIWWLSDDYPMTIQWLSIDYPMTIQWLLRTFDLFFLVIIDLKWSIDRRWFFKSSATFILRWSCLTVGTLCSGAKSGLLEESMSLLLTPLKKKGEWSQFQNRPIFIDFKDFQDKENGVAE